ACKELQVIKIPDGFYCAIVGRTIRQQFKPEMRSIGNQEIGIPQETVYPFIPVSVCWYIYFLIDDGAILQYPRTKKLWIIARTGRTTNPIIHQRGLVEKGESCQVNCCIRMRYHFDLNNNRCLMTRHICTGIQRWHTHAGRATYTWRTAMLTHKAGLEMDNARCNFSTAQWLRIGRNKLGEVHVGIITHKRFAVVEVVLNNTVDDNNIDRQDTVTSLD